MQTAEINPRQNRLLKSFPVHVQERLFPALRLQFLSSGTVLYEPGQAISDLWFPIDSVVALLCSMEDGCSTQVDVVGNEGVLGISAIMSDASVNIHGLVCVAGHAYVLPAQRLRREFDDSAEVRTVLLHYAQSVITAVAQTAFCNRHHSVQQQVSRWLLRFLDRVPDKNLHITQESIARVLGVRAASVSEVASHLKSLGVINYQRGNIVVMNRARLEQLTCNCYRTSVTWRTVQTASGTP